MNFGDTPLVVDGHRFVLTGRFATMTQSQTRSLIERSGGIVDLHPDVATDWIVVGDGGWPLREDGRLTKDLALAEKLRTDGAGVRIVGEREFVAHLRPRSMSDDVTGLYTTQQLGRILDVPPADIRVWIRRGLIRPVKVHKRLDYFGFAEVAAAKALQEMLTSGVASSRIRRSLEQLETWIPGARASIAQLDLLERDGEIVVRLDDGSIADATGQLRFDLDQSDNVDDGNGSDTASTTPSSSPRQTDSPVLPFRAPDELDRALDLEEEGRLDEAAAVYYEALMTHGPRAEYCFNLGNVLYQLGRFDAAAERYRQTLEIEMEWVESWNNLGSTLRELGRNEEAVAAFRRGLDVDPDYADCHYNLAETLFEIDDRDGAVRHWRSYLAYDATSRWAEHVRSRLEDSRERPSGPQLK